MAKNEKRDKYKQQLWDIRNNGGAAYAVQFGGTSNNPTALMEGMDLVYSTRAMNPEASIIFRGATAYYQMILAESIHKKWEEDGRQGEEPALPNTEGIQLALHDYGHLVEAATARDEILRNAYESIPLGLAIDEIGPRFSTKVKDELDKVKDVKISDLEDKHDAADHLLNFHIRANVGRQIAERQLNGNLEKTLFPNPAP